MITIQNNKVLKAVTKLLKVLKTSSVEELQEAAKTLGQFSDSWLVDGTQIELEGAGPCCLSDTDTALAVKEVIESTWLQ